MIRLIIYLCYTNHLYFVLNHMPLAQLEGLWPDVELMPEETENGHACTEDTVKQVKRGTYNIVYKS